MAQKTAGWRFPREQAEVYLTILLANEKCVVIHLDFLAITLEILSHRAGVLYVCV